MLGIFGVLFIVIGGFALAGSTTIVGQIGGLILWVIAALFIVGQALISAIEREARGVGKVLALVVRGGTAEQPRSEPSAPPEKQSLWERFKKN